MNPIHNILVIVDPTAEQHPAAAKGALLAEDELAVPLRARGLDVTTETRAR